MRERSRWRYWVLQYHVPETYRVSGHAQEFLIPQLDEDDQEGRIHFQQDGKKASCKSDARDAT